MLYKFLNKTKCMKFYEKDKSSENEYKIFYNISAIVLLCSESLMVSMSLNVPKNCLLHM